MVAIQKGLRGSHFKEPLKKGFFLIFLFVFYHVPNLCEFLDVVKEQLFKRGQVCT